MFGMFECFLRIAKFAKIEFQFSGIYFGAFVNPRVLDGDGSCNGERFR